MLFELLITSLTCLFEYLLYNIEVFEFVEINSFYNSKKIFCTKMYPLPLQNLI